MRKRNSAGSFFVLVMTVLALCGCSNVPASSSKTLSPQINSMSSGTSEKINLTAVTPDSIKKAGALHIGTDLTYEPYEYIGDDGKPTGYDWEIWQMIAKDLGVKLQYEDLAFSGIFAGLETGKYDVAACSCLINKERAEKYAFCEPVYGSAYSIVKNSGDGSIKTTDDLTGKKIGVQVGSSTQTAVESYNEKLKSTKGNGFASIEKYNVSTDAFLDLSNKNIDAVCENISICKKQVDNSNGSMVMVGNIGDPIYSSFAFRKSDTEFLKYVNDEITKFKQNGELEKLMIKYFKSADTNLPDKAADYLPQ
jgi:polar amino acid transport system substrate-binding protein